ETLAASGRLDGNPQTVSRISPLRHGRLSPLGSGRTGGTGTPPSDPFRARRYRAWLLGLRPLVHSEPPAKNPVARACRHRSLTHSSSRARCRGHRGTKAATGTNRLGRRRGGLPRLAG